MSEIMCDLLGGPQQAEFASHPKGGSNSILKAILPGFSGSPFVDPGSSWEGGAQSHAVGFGEGAREGRGHRIGQRRQGRSRWDLVQLASFPWPKPIINHKLLGLRDAI